MAWFIFTIKSYKLKLRTFVIYFWYRCRRCRHCCCWCHFRLINLVLWCQYLTATYIFCVIIFDKFMEFMEQTSGACIQKKIDVLTECRSFVILTTQYMNTASNGWTTTTTNKKLPIKGLNISVARNCSKFKQNKVCCVAFVLMMHSER